MVTTFRIMESPSIIQKLCHLIGIVETLAENAVYYKSNCQHVADFVSLLKEPLDELQQLEMSWNSDELSPFSTLEFILLKLKELFESCNGKISKLILILRKRLEFEELSSKLQALLKTSPFDTLPFSENCKILVQKCIRGLESVDGAEGSDTCVVEEVDHALREIKKGVKLSHETLVHLAKQLGLKSNQELLKEASVLENQKFAQVNRNKNDEELLNLLIVFVTQMTDDLMEQKILQAQKQGIDIPRDFLCPLSLELMSDPVIVVSGQTFERANIQQWLDEGNTTCPQSRRTLNHFTLTNNVTVKGLIESWCEQNGVSLHEPRKTPTRFPQSTPVRISNGIQRSTDYDAALLNTGTAVTKKHAEDSVQTIATCQGKCESGGMTGAAGCSAETRRVFPQGGLRDAILQQPDRESLLSLKGECSGDGLVSLGGYMSIPCHGSSSNHIPDQMDAKRSISLPIKLRGDASGNFGNLELSSPSVSLHGEEDGASEHNLVSMGRRGARTVSNLHQNVHPDAGIDSDGGNVHSKVQGLVRDLQSASWEVQRNAATELRLLAKSDVENRIIIADSGAISPLISLLYSEDSQIQENAVTALLNLSINNNNKSEIASANAIDPLVHVLNFGTSEARENAAATLFSLSVINENKIAIGESRAIDPLVHLLTTGTPRGKKDAATALFNLSICQDNKLRIVQARAVRPLVRLMSDPAAGMVDKAVAVIANLATIKEGCISIDQEEGIPVLAEVVEMGSQRGKENAAAALLNLCKNSNRSKTKVLQEGVIPPLVVLAQTGTARAKEKASELLRLFRDQRHGRGADMHAGRRR